MKSKKTSKLPAAVDRADAIIDSAARFLNVHGVSEEWFGEIADDVGITRPALYSHFGNRDDLLYACYDRSIAALAATLEDARKGGADAAAVLRNFLDLTISSQFPDLAVVSEVGGLAPVRRADIKARWSRLADSVAVVVRDGIAAGQFRAADPTVVAHSVLGLATWAPLQRRLMPNSPVEAISSGVREFFFQGLAVEPALQPQCMAVRFLNDGERLDPFDKASLEIAKRERILGAASGLFNRKGVGATTLEEIGAEVGLSKRALYRLFRSKDDIVSGCFERTIDYNLGIIHAATLFPGARLQALHTAIRSVVLGLGDDVAPNLTTHVGLGRFAPVVEGAIQDRVATLAREYAGLIEQGVVDGSIRQVPVLDVVAALAGNLSWVATTDLGAAGLTCDHVATELADIAAIGILARSATDLKS